MDEIENLKFQVAAEKKRVELCDAVIKKQEEKLAVAGTALGIVEPYLRWLGEHELSFYPVSRRVILGGVQDALEQLAGRGELLEALTALKAPLQAQKPCPECNREMRAKTHQTPETSWRCDYCKATWTAVTDIKQEPLQPEGKS